MNTRSAILNLTLSVLVLSLGHPATAADGLTLVEKEFKSCLFRSKDTLLKNCETERGNLELLNGGNITVVAECVATDAPCGNPASGQWYPAFNLKLTIPGANQEKFTVDSLRKNFGSKKACEESRKAIQGSYPNKDKNTAFTARFACSSAGMLTADFDFNLHYQERFFRSMGSDEWNRVTTQRKTSILREKRARAGQVATGEQAAPSLPSFISVGAVSGN